MASSASVESFLGKIQECSICRNRFEEPKILDCSHSFCLKCLLQLRQRQEDARVTKLTCPTCGRGTEAEDDDDVKHLPDDFILSTLSGFTLQDQLVQGQGLEVKCQACDEKMKAVSKCMDCDHFLCEECQRAHQRLALMKAHQICTLTQLRLGEVRKQRDEPKCGEHPDQTLRFYCNTCEMLVCKICFDLHHGGHHQIGLPEALEKCKRDVKDLATKVKETITELMRIGVEDVHKSQQKLDAMFEITKRKISEKADKEIATIRGEEQRLKQEAVTIYNDRVETFESVKATSRKEVSEAGHKLDEVNQLMSQLGCHAIVHLRHRILQELQTLLQSQRDLIGKQQGKFSSKLSFLDFEIWGRDVLPLGRLLDKPEARPRLKSDDLHQPVSTKDRKWELKARVQTFGPTRTGFRWACNVGIYSTGEIVVADTAHKRLVEIQPSNLESNAISLQPNCSNPVCVAVNKNDQLLTLDGPFVKIFDRKRMYKLVHQFTPAQGPHSKPTCLAVDDGNLIAVGYEKTEQISLHHPNGSLLRRVPAAMTIENLTASRQRLIFTNWDRKKLVAVDYHGKLVFCVDTNQSMARNWGPAGVCCGGDGSIYLAVCGLGSSSGEIHHFGLDGKYVRCLVQDCGSPRGIAFSAKEDSLVVAAGNSVHIFHCK
ncbi:E3 ubiquitin-protein ligase TRIM33-like [Patiria miniata]|uniref:Uncharacterized protein n=1 Tax=Patiria miniata TaxID=46514 RepID=A0A914A5M2_PATMI|nr:E3 ubiquitin-protein ligase TRIM33-like [Patiria miniata]